MALYYVSLSASHGIFSEKIYFKKDLSLLNLRQFIINHFTYLKIFIRVYFSITRPPIRYQTRLDSDNSILTLIWLLVTFRLSSHRKKT